MAMDGASLSPPPTPGRGAPSNRLSQRFGLNQAEWDGDWLDAMPLVDGLAPRVRTEVTTDHPRTIISRNASPDIGFDRSINAYRGCEHGCIYCYARPTHAYLDLSPGIDFETRLFAKPEAAALLRKELAAPGYRVAPLAIGTNTDPYQPVEREWGITRQILEVMLETRHPLLITTKSDRIVRDLDLLEQMAALNLVYVAISVTSLDAELARKLEPRAPHPAKRLQAIGALAAAGVPVQVNVSPIIPCLTDQDLEAILAQAAKTGARRASYILLRLPHEVAPLFREWLQAHFPDRAEKVMNIHRAMRGGRDNDPEFGGRMRGQGIWADLIRTRFRRATAGLGLSRNPPALCSSAFRPPSRNGQLSLF